MKHLFKIDFEHVGPKDSESGIKGYVIASNDEQVFNFLGGHQSYKDLKDPFGIYTSWLDTDDEDDDNDNDDEDYEDDCEYDNNAQIETKQEKLLRLKGDINDEDRDYDGAYYGLSFYGWEDLGEISEEEILTIKKFLKNDIVILHE